MKRRSFIKSAGALSLGNLFPSRGLEPVDLQERLDQCMTAEDGPNWRLLFPRLENEVYLNAAGGTPLSAFSELANQDYLEFWKYGGAENRAAILNETRLSVRADFARLINADESEIALVSCTKEGEQIVLDSLDPWRDGGNVVTNVFHFSGSLHNLEGHRRSGRDVRIVRGEGWNVSAQDMLEAIDERTNLINISLVSNINGRVEPIAPLVHRAREVGAYIFADIIQAAGVTPVDVKALGIDFASCSAYKWLFGPHGVGFFYVQKEHQGSVLRDRLYPGHSSLLFEPWSSETGAEKGPLSFVEPSGARRYESGHHSYLGYASVRAAMRFLESAGHQKVEEHCLKLAQKLEREIDQDRFPCISPLPLQTPIVSFARNNQDVMPALSERNLTITVTDRFIRVSPSIYNTEEDVELLVDALKQSE